MRNVYEYVGLINENKCSNFTEGATNEMFYGSCKHIYLYVCIPLGILKVGIVGFCCLFPSNKLTNACQQLQM